MLRPSSVFDGDGDGNEGVQVVVICRRRGGFDAESSAMDRGGARILIRPGLKLKSNKKLFKKIKYNKIAYTKSFEQIFIKIYHVQH